MPSELKKENDSDLGPPRKYKLKRFKMYTRYIHKRSEGLTHRRNAGSQWQS